MNAIKFIEERNRMCNYCHGCNACPGKEGVELCVFSVSSGISAKEQVAIVEKWSAEHPRKTRQSVFLERYPNVRLVDGVVDIAPCQMEPENYSIAAAAGCACKHAPCVICRSKSWMQEVE